MPTTTVTGSLPRIIRNTDNLYEGDLIEYLRIVFYRAKNARAPYHNFRHLMHVLWLCHDACIFYGNETTPRQRRNLLIAAMFHDFNHSGRKEQDSRQIAEAVKGFRERVLPPDEPEIENIVSLIEYTEFPYTIPSSDIPLEAQILRDADKSQAMSAAWLQQVVFGLAEEWNTAPIEVLRMQIKFHESIGFATDWGRWKFSQAVIDQKIAEVSELLEILNTEPI